jgi:hypothetical protein
MGEAMATEKTGGWERFDPAGGQLLVAKHKKQWSVVSGQKTPTDRWPLFFSLPARFG